MNVEIDSLVATVSSRVQECADKLGSGEVLAKKSGISRRSLEYYLKGTVDPKLTKLKLIADAAEVPLTWLVGGQEIAPDSTTASYSYVPKMNIEVSAGHGSHNGEEHEKESLAFREDWLRSKGLKSKNLALVSVRGDSMEPTLPDLSILLVNTLETKPGDGIYILLIEDQLYAKRLQVELDGSINIISDNPAYKTLTIEKGSSIRADIRGRVVWVGMDF